MPGCHVQPEQMFNLIFGFNAQYLEVVEGAGTNANVFVVGAAVPADQVWVITGASVQHNDPVARVAILGIGDGVTTYPFMYSAALPQWVVLTDPVMWVLVEGDALYAQVNSLAVGRFMWLRVNGYKMVLAQ